MDRIGLPLPWGIVPTEVRRESIAVVAPAAGADWSFRVPSGQEVVLLGFRAQLVTAVAVANRLPRLAWSDADGNESQIVTLAPAIPASLTTILGGALDADPQAGTAGGSSSAGLPPVRTEVGWTIGVVTIGIQAADQWSGIRLYVARYEVRGLERAVERYERQVAEAIAAPG